MWRIELFLLLLCKLLSVTDNNQWQAWKSPWSDAPCHSHHKWPYIWEEQHRWWAKLLSNSGRQGHSQGCSCLSCSGLVWTGGGMTLASSSPTQTYLGTASVTCPLHGPDCACRSQLSQTQVLEKKSKAFSGYIHMQIWHFCHLYMMDTCGFIDMIPLCELLCTPKGPYYCPDLSGWILLILFNC